MSNTFGLVDNQHVTVTIGFDDAAGQPVAATIDAGSLVVTSSDPASLAVEIGADGASFTCTAEGPLDAAVDVSVACTVNGAAFTGSITFDVGAGAPTSLVLTPGTPADN